MKYVTVIGEQEFRIEILDERRVDVDGTIYEVDFDALSDQPVYSLLVDGQSFEAHVHPGEDSWQVIMLGRFYPAVVEDERERRLREASGGLISGAVDFHLKAPMPGLVVSIPVEDGQDVEKGDVLLILESMKMQNELKSPRSGVVSRLGVKLGDSVEQNETMLSIV